MQIMSKRIEIDKKKWRGKYVSKRKNRIFYEALTNYVSQDSHKAGILRRFLLPTKFILLTLLVVRILKVK